MNHIDKSSFNFRRWAYSAFILFFLLVLQISFIRLQVGKKEIYTRQSIDNSIRKVQINPVRGLICDSDGDILVDTRSSFAVAVIPKVIKKESKIYLSKLFKIDEKELDLKIHKNFGFRPLIIARDISQEQLAVFEENRLQLPGVLTVIEPKRFYPSHVNSPHIFGSMGEVTRAEQIINPAYMQGDLIGKTGIEKKYDLDLRGSKGLRYLRVDAAGKELGLYDADQNVTPVHGNDLFLYMDYEMQQFAESLLVDNRGALVAIDVRNGGVIALVSKPDFDPRLLSGKIDRAEWESLLADESHPLYSRAIQSGYPPGSTYKIVAAIAALEEGIITPKWKASCPGFFKLGRRTIKCWNTKGHGTIDLLEAIKGSCNVYFYKLGLKIGLQAWSKYSRLLGFGSRTGIDLPNENKGLVPSIEYFNKVFGPRGWTKGNLANLAIGQGELLTTPLQLCQFAMILANKGVYHSPHIADKMLDYTTTAIIKFPRETKYITGISNSTYDIIREGMRQVVNGGTGWLGKVPGIEMAGKTGTAQNPHGEDHALFLAFAPFDFPEVAIAVILENAGGGGAVAAPIARKFLEKYFYNKLIPRHIAKKDSAAQSRSDTVLAPINIDNIRPIQVYNPGDEVE